MVVAWKIRQRLIQAALVWMIGLCPPICAGAAMPPPSCLNALAVAPGSPAAPALPDLRTIKQVAVRQAHAELHQQGLVLRQKLLAADDREIVALRAAITAAMKAGRVSAVLAAHHLLKVAQAQCQSDRTVPPFINVWPARETAAAGLSKPLRSIVAARAQVARSVAKAWAIAWFQAQVAYPQLVIKEVQLQVAGLKTALRAAMAAGNVHAVLREAKALKLANAEIAIQRRAIRNAKAQLAIATGAAAQRQSSFMGNGSNATRIIYILDHEGSMLENFTFLKSHLRKSIDGLVPSQSFAVIVFRKNYKILGPNRLVHATLRNKQEVFQRFRTVAPAGATEYRFSYFARPFKAAFRLHPQIIYFLTKGAFDPKLLGYINSLNQNHAVRIYTYAFTVQDPASQKNLKKIAQQNGGQYKYISREEAGG